MKSLKRQLESRTKVDGDSDCRIVEECSNVQLRSDVEHILEVDVPSRIQSEIQVVDGIIHIKANVIIAHEVLASDAQIERIECSAKTGLCNDNNVIRNSVTHRSIERNPCRENIQEGRRITRTEVPRPLRLARVLSERERCSRNCEERENKLFHLK